MTGPIERKDNDSPEAISDRCARHPPPKILTARVLPLGTVELEAGVRDAGPLPAGRCSAVAIEDRGCLSSLLGAPGRGDVTVPPGIGVAAGCRVAAVGSNKPVGVGAERFNLLIVLLVPLAHGWS